MPFQIPYRQIASEFSGLSRRAGAQIDRNFDEVEKRLTYPPIWQGRLTADQTGLTPSTVHKINLTERRNTRPTSFSWNDSTDVLSVGEPGTYVIDWQIRSNGVGVGYHLGYPLINTTEARGSQVVAATNATVVFSGCATHFFSGPGTISLSYYHTDAGNDRVEATDGQTYMIVRQVANYPALV